MGTNDILIQIFDRPGDAPNYNDDGEGVKAATIDKAIIIRNGTVGGNPTVDIQFTDMNGQRYVALITAHLLKNVCVAAGVALP